MVEARRLARDRVTELLSRASAEKLRADTADARTAEVEKEVTAIRIENITAHAATAALATKLREASTVNAMGRAEAFDEALSRAQVGLTDELLAALLEHTLGVVERLASGRPISECRLNSTKKIFQRRFGPDVPQGRGLLDALGYVQGTVARY